MADGGMVRHRFEGKGGPRDDQIPVTVAGEKIKVSDGEEAVILPAKTAKSPQAIAQIADAIQQSNDEEGDQRGARHGQYRPPTEQPRAAIPKAIHGFERGGAEGEIHRRSVGVT